MIKTIIIKNAFSRLNNCTTVNCLLLLGHFKVMTDPKKPTPSEQEHSRLMKKNLA